MPKSRVRKKNGKKVKFAPKPKGLSKTKMKKLMEMIEQQKSSLEANKEVVENRDGSSPLEISKDFTKKLNVVANDNVDLKGPELSKIDEKTEE
jgi:mRNA-degrading endonuclease HigB of HigAB toxin-antitoxin module